MELEIRSSNSPLRIDAIRRPGFTTAGKPRRASQPAMQEGFAKGCRIPSVDSTLGVFGRPETGLAFKSESQSSDCTTRILSAAAKRRRQGSEVAEGERRPIDRSEEKSQSRVTG